MTIQDQAKAASNHEISTGPRRGPFEGLGTRLQSWPRYRQAAGWIRRYGDLLWWLHSGYALLLGILFMWLGSRLFALVRITLFYIAFLWLSALFLPLLVNHPQLSPRWQHRARLVINYFNKNFYQQLLFFLLPLYYSSSTLTSGNFLFVLLLSGSAVLSTLDIFYDRYISRRWPLTSVYLTFNLFACFNLMLPVMWGISNGRTLWISAALALGCYASLVYRLAGWQGRAFHYAVGSASAILLGIVVLLRSFIPPAPLRLARAEFGISVQNLEMVAPLTEVPPSWKGRIAALTAVKAPNGLKDRIRHRWYLDGNLVYSQEPRTIVGGREQGFRLWSQITWNGNSAARQITLDVETEGGQLIGRAGLPVGH
jgi:hypothetical protein